MSSSVKCFKNLKYKHTQIITLIIKLLALQSMVTMGLTYFVNMKYFFLHLPRVNHLTYQLVPIQVNTFAILDRPNVLGLSETKMQPWFAKYL